MQCCPSCSQVPKLFLSENPLPPYQIHLQTKNSWLLSVSISRFCSWPEAPPTHLPLPLTLPYWSPTPASLGKHISSRWIGEDSPILTTLHSIFHGFSGYFPPLSPKKHKQQNHLFWESWWSTKNYPFWFQSTSNLHRGSTFDFSKSMMTPKSQVSTQVANLISASSQRSCWPSLLSTKKVASCKKKRGKVEGLSESA